MKILNLYAGIGGNRRFWGNDHEITAIEYDKDIAKVYSKLFPSDKMIVTDAHEYLLNHFTEFDFIWASPPCPSHSCIRRAHFTKKTQTARALVIYPDMRLYQEIILLKEFVPKEKKWVVENVMPYYKPLIPGKRLQRHLFWSNFHLDFKKFNQIGIIEKSVNEWKEIMNIDLTKFDLPYSRIEQIYRNCVDSEVSEHIFNCAINPKQLTLCQ